jgi:predicted O-methyltransferase YrrM
MPDALYCASKLDHLTFAFKQAPPGLALEFGVFKGTTINHLARLAPGRRFFGFDSFTGLPEDWAGSRYSAVNFDRGGKKPKVAGNVTLIEGWFDKTLPEFLAREPGSIGFLHVDCDIYSSTKTVLDLCAARLAPGAVIVFDEFFNYKGYELTSTRRSSSSWSASTWRIALSGTRDSRCRWWWRRCGGLARDLSSRNFAKRNIRDPGLRIPRASRAAPGSRIIAARFPG